MKNLSLSHVHCHLLINDRKHYMHAMLINASVWGPVMFAKEHCLSYCEAFYWCCGVPSSQARCQYKTFGLLMIRLTWQDQRQEIYNKHHSLLSGERWTEQNLCSFELHDDIIKWKHFPRNWPFVQGIHRSPVNSPHKGQWHGVSCDLHLNKRLSTQWWGWWFETASRSLWHHCNDELQTKLNFI